MISGHWGARLLPRQQSANQTGMANVSLPPSPTYGHATGVSYLEVSRWGSIPHDFSPEEMDPRRETDTIICTSGNQRMEHS